MLCEDNTGRSCLLELRDAFWVPSYARNLVSVKRLTDKGGNDPVQRQPNHQYAQWNCCANDDIRRTFQCNGSTCGDGVTSNDVSLCQALATINGAQQLARCGKVAARCRGHEHIWLRKEDELQHLLHREGEAGIHSKDVGHSSENETGYRSHGRAGTCMEQESHEGFSKIERAWGTVTGMTPCMMTTAGVPKQFWPFALSTATYLKNRSIHSAHGKTPFEMFHGNITDVSRSLTFHIFTCFGASRLCSTKSGRSWTARHGKLLYWDTREILRHMW